MSNRSSGPGVAWYCIQYVKKAMALFLIVIYAWALGGMLVSPVRFGDGLIFLFQIDKWFEPVAAMSVAERHHMHEVFFYSSFMIIVSAFMIYVIFRAMGGGFMNGTADVATATFKNVFWKHDVKKAKEKAIKQVRSYYSGDSLYPHDLASGEHVIGGGLIVKVSENEVDSIIEKIAQDEIDDAYISKLGPRSEITRDEYTRSFVKDAMIEIMQRSDKVSTNVPITHHYLGGTTQNWMKSRDIYIDTDVKLAFHDKGVIEPSLLAHVIRLLSSADRFVISVPMSGGSKSLLEARRAFEMDAEAVSVSREFYHDDEIPENRDEVIRWALAQVEEHRASMSEEVQER